MTDQKQMNERLAEWSGFTCSVQVFTDIRKYKVTYWYDPEGNEVGNDPPDFFNEDTGMPLLFKWVIPELRKKYGELRISFEDWLAGNIQAVECIIEYQIGVRRWKILITSNPEIHTKEISAFATACYKAVEECER